MKSITQNIQTEIKRQDFIDALKDLPNWTISNGWGNAIPQNDGVTIEEQIIRLNEILSFLKRNSKLLDGLTWTKRNQISSYLSQNIIPWTIQIINGNQGQGILKNRSDHVDALYELLLPYLIIEKKSDKILEEKIDFNEIKVSYQESITKLEQILKHKDIIDKFIGAKDIIIIIEELKNQAQSKKDEIDKVGDMLDQYDKTYLDVTGNINKANEKLTNLIAENASLKIKGDEILSEFSEILKNATSGVASIELNNMAEKIKLQQRIWFMVISTLLGGILVLRAYGALSFVVQTTIDNKELIKQTWLSGINIKDMDSIALIVLRRFLLIPFLMLDYFFYRQYEFYKKLKEEYKFKATVSGTLQNYVSILRTNEERQGMKEYIMELTRDILKSPIPNNEDSLDKKGKELLNKVFDKGINMAEKRISSVGE